MSTESTERLIRQLSSDVARVPPNAVTRRIAIGIATGCVLAALYMGATIGVRPDLDAAIQGSSFWIKAAYTLSIAMVAMSTAVKLARPDASVPRGLWLLAVPALLLAGVGVVELASTPSGDWLAMWLGQSWRNCPWHVLTLSIPIFAGLLWSFRRLAPTHFRAAGAAAGLSAGGWAATIYCLHCPEVSAVFVLTWYTLGIALTASVGALMGSRLLRW